MRQSDTRLAVSCIPLWHVHVLACEHACVLNWSKRARRELSMFCALPPPQDADVVHTEDRVDPVADMEIIHHELRLKDIERMTNIVALLQKVPRSPGLRA